MPPSVVLDEMMSSAEPADRRAGRLRQPQTAVAVYGALSDRPAFQAACVLLVSAFALGGAARADVATLILLRPVAILLLGFGLLGMTARHVLEFRYLFAIALTMLVYTLVQLVPLPAALWSRLPGRDIIVQIDAVAGLGPVWRPMSMAPAGTVNAFLALLVPFAMLVLGARLGHAGRRLMLPLAIALGMISALIAVLQILGPPDGPLYFYQVTNSGSAVGLFANRNHQAVLLGAMIPMLAVFASLRWYRLQQRAAMLLAIGIGAILVPLLFITGSRVGLVTGGVGLASCAILYRPASADGQSPTARGAARRLAGRGRAMVPRGGSWALAAALVALVAVLSVVSVGRGRGEAFQRLLSPGAMADTRFKSWGEISNAVWAYFPFGSGAGSFVEIFQLREPRRLLSSTYLNHAHNDWLEVLLTDGLPALVLLAFAVVLTVARAVQLSPYGRRELDERAVFARLGLVLVGQFAIASSGDYPLRTPALACLFALAALWAASPLKGLGNMSDGLVGNRKAAKI